ncbi:hypothetical protein EVAR_29696_1 [Eumeta japonica]|uniref:Peptidase aspartic putative domain-containing protein n=1 Tax=Eumeta variegata TaxID=151549 RepID=A0A4C1W0Y7_EUMVA|nr:hypothetical protein EVAR_29696_1 [Eumeta japonica]
MNVKMICPLCNNEYGLPDCGEFVKLNISERWDAAKKLRMCFRYLKGRHVQAMCRGKPCKTCQGGHHRLLHQERTSRGGHEGSAYTTAVVTEHAAISVNNVNTMRAYFKIIPVKLYGSEESMKVHAVLNEGSTVTIFNEQRVERATVAACLHLKDIAENLIYDNAAPCILIDQDNWGLIVSRQIKSGRANQPAASLTQLGWVLHGHCSSLSQPINTVHHLRPFNASNVKVNNSMKQHFKIESFSVAPHKPSHDPEERVLLLLDSNSVRLPSEPAPNKSKSERLWYLFHFAVTHPQKKKVVLVFDAAARTIGKCLNDALLTSPDLIRSLLDVLVRFRQGRVAVSADINEMFLRVKIKKEDRDSLRFLWQNNLNENPQEYRMTSLIFGAASWPCTAIYIKSRNASEFELEYPEVCKAIQLDHYVDDFLKSFKSINEAKGVSKQWDIKNDTLSFNLGLRNTLTEVLKTSLPPTKRQVTSAVMSVFDPLGLASPVLITGKCMLEDAWRSGLDWDEIIEADEHKKWLKWVNGMRKLASIRVP